MVELDLQQICIRVSPEQEFAIDPTHIALPGWLELLRNNGMPWL